jgi:hypothetical protein
MKNKITYKPNLSLENLPGEAWKDVPGLDGVAELSNYGRVKTVRRWVERAGIGGGFWKKDRILTNRVQVQELVYLKRKKYQLAVSVGFEGKKYSFAIGRMVHYLFVKKFKLEDRHILTSYKDGNPFNVHYQNLLLTTSSLSIINAYNKDHRPLECFGNKANSIVQYDKKGKKIATFKSIYQAARATALKMSTITGQLKNGIGYTGGFIWRYEKGASNNKVVTPAIRNKMASVQFHTEVISQYDLSGKKLTEFENLNVAAKVVSIQPNQIKRVIEGKLSSAAGYYWQLGKGKKMVNTDHLRQKRKLYLEQKSRPVTQYGLDGNFIEHHKSVTSASSSTNISIMAIFSALKDGAGTRTGKGFIWKYGKGRKKMVVSDRVKKKLYLHNLYIQPVTQYSLDGKRVATHANLKDAAKKMNGQHHQLVLVIEGKRLSFKNFCWVLGKGARHINVDIKSAQIARRKKIPKPVVQLSLSGNKLKEYSSIAEASIQTGISSQYIAAAARGRHTSAKGFKWGYKKI